MNLKNIQNIGVIALFIGLFIAFSCKKDNNTPGYGHILATVDYTSIKAQQDTILFTDMSTVVDKRTWTFQGGTPATSTDSIVHVTYTDGGVFTAQLIVSYQNTQQKSDTMHFTISVKGKVKENTYAIYTDDLTIAPGTTVKIGNDHAFPFTTINSGMYEGTNALHFNIDGSDTWAMASIKPIAASVDISKYATGYYNVAMKSSATGANGVILLRLQSNSDANKAIITFDDTSLYGFKRDGQWHMLSIPIADFVAINPKLDLTAISSFLILRSGAGNVLNANNYDFQLDNFYLSLIKY